MENFKTATQLSLVDRVANMTQTLCVNTFYEQHRQAQITFGDNLKAVLKTYITKFPMKNSNKILNSNNFKQKLL